MVFRFKKRNLMLESLELGSQALPPWPVIDTLPSDLDRLNLVDVILGHDVLGPYQLTIDLPGRVQQLRPGTAKAGKEAAAEDRMDLKGP